MTGSASTGTITGMDRADHAMQITRRLLDLAYDLDLDRGVIGMAMIGAGIMLLAEVDPVTAEGLARVLGGQPAAIYRSGISI